MELPPQALEILEAKMTKLDQIRAEAEAATEGPWESLPTPKRGWFVIGRAVPKIRKDGKPYKSGLKEHPWITHPSSNVHLSGVNALFIAHARTNVPLLCDALEVARTTLEAIKPHSGLAEHTITRIDHILDQILAGESNG